MPPLLGLNAEGLLVLSAAAEEDNRTPEEYVEEGLIVLLGVGEVLLQNREAGKVDTHFVYQAEDGTYFKGEDIEGMLRENQRGLTIVPKDTSFNVLDPFENGDDETTEVAINPLLRDQVTEIGDKLGFELKAMMQFAIDLRRQLQVCGQHDDALFVEKADPEELAVLPTIFNE